MLPIAKEFQSLFLVGTLVLFGLQMWVGPAATVLWLFWLIFVFFVRDFHRDIPPIPLANISPIDGVVTDIAVANDPFIDRQALRYTILQSKWGEFNLHSPTEGKVEQLWVQGPNGNSKALVFWLQTDEQDDVVVHIELNSGFQHASTTLHPGERVGQGRRCGFVARECRVHIYLPQTSKAIAQENDKVIAGKNIIAKFIR